MGLLGGAAALMPLAARPQQAGAPRRIGVLLSLSVDDPLGPPRMTAFLRGLRELGWEHGRNVRIDVRWTAGNPETIAKFAAELAATKPDVLVATGSATLAPLLQVARTLPIVFVHVPDPVGAGYVESLARPGGNATGFVIFEYATSAKWVELLKRAAPGVKRAAVVRDPAITAGIGQWGAIQTVAPALGIEAIPLNLRDAQELERSVAAFARSPDGGLIVTGSGLAVLHRDLLVRLAARHRLPAIYFDRQFVAAGGLMSYGPNLLDQYRRAAGYVDRILKGAKPADLPVQSPTTYDLSINLKAAKALNLAIPDALLVTATEVIE
jgi:putative ABC transport system substrate-binding protein